MHLRAKIAMSVTFLIIVLGSCCLLYYYTSVRVDTSTIDYIKSMQKHPNEFLDLASDINVESADDVGYVVKGDYYLVIHYGSQVFEMNRNCFKSDDYINRLKSIGIKVYHKEKDGKILYKVTYWDDPVTEWSLVN